MRDYLTAADVARGFRRSLSWFNNNRKSLEARGFPAPIDGCGLRWDPIAIARWQDAQLPPREANPDAAAEALLIERAQRMANAA